jgi:hypothetical protein
MAKPNPSPCCGLSVGCCDSPLPETLKATFESVSTCPCANGLEVTLVWHPIDNMWIGQGPGGGGCSLRGDTFQFRCGGTDCQAFKFTVVGAGSCITSSNSQVGDCECDPLHVVFQIALVGLGCCDSEFGGGTIRVTVTE